MALVPIISQTWDTTSVFNPTRMNNIENNIAIAATAEGTQYSNGVSVKDKIDSVLSLKLLYTINANAYSNYENALKKIYEIYNSLSLNDKVHCLIVRNDDVVYSLSAFSGAFKTSYPSSTTASIEESLYLPTGIYIRNTFTVNANVQITSRSAEAQEQTLKFYLSRGN